MDILFAVEPLECMYVYPEAGRPLVRVLPSEKQTIIAVLWMGPLTVWPLAVSVRVCCVVMCCECSGRN